jgi:hypothetical protein
LTSAPTWVTTPAISCLHKLIPLTNMMFCFPWGIQCIDLKTHLPRNQRIFWIIEHVPCPTNVSITDSTVYDLQRNIAVLHCSENYYTYSSSHKKTLISCWTERQARCCLHLNFCIRIRPKMLTQCPIVSINFII